MGKVKTSKKQDFSLKHMPKMKLKKGVKVLKDTSIKNLKSKERVQRALAEAIFSDDLEAFREILQGYLEVVNVSNLAKETGLPRKTIYRMLEPDSNPTLKNVTKLLYKIVA